MCLLITVALPAGTSSGSYLENINARAHFLVLLTPSALERCGDPTELLRREIEAALESRRNIVPLMLEGFTFDTPTLASQLTGKLENCAAPTRLDDNFPLYPGLRFASSWANFNSTPSGFYFRTPPPKTKARETLIKWPRWKSWPLGQRLSC
jgi:hypothetical protein